MRSEDLLTRLGQRIPAAVDAPFVPARLCTVVSATVGVALSRRGRPGTDEERYADAARRGEGSRPQPSRPVRGLGAAECGLTRELGIEIAEQAIVADPAAACEAVTTARSRRLPWRSTTSTRATRRSR